MEIGSPTADDSAAAGLRRKKHRSGPVVAEFSAARQAHSKVAFTTRRVPSTAMKTLIMGPIRPRSGDLVLARVERLGYQTRLELPCGRKACLHVGDEIVDTWRENYPYDERMTRQDYEEQKRAFLKRAVMQALGRRAGKGGLRVLSEKKLEEKAAAAMAELKEHTWGKRISSP